MPEEPSQPSTIKEETPETQSLTLSLMRQELGDDEVRIRLAMLRSLMTVGDNDFGILSKTGWDPEALTVLQKELYRSELTRLARPAEEVFVDYVLHQQEGIRDLNKLIERLMSAKETVTDPTTGQDQVIDSVKHATAVVGAVKTKADIWDRMVQRGQDLGLIHRAPKRQEIIAGIAVTQISTRELKGEVGKAMAAFKGLLDRYGDAELASAKTVSATTIAGAGKKSRNNGDREPGRTDRARRIAGRGVDRARAARGRVRSEVRVRREKAKEPPPEP